jgi:hypothetical protein
VEQFINNQVNHDGGNYNILISNNKDEIINWKPNKLSFVLSIFDESIIHSLSTNDNHKNCEISILQTEPLNLSWWFNTILDNHSKYPYVKIYDYSKSNIKILNQHNITNCEYLPYNIQQDEFNKLTKFLSENRNNGVNELYDFGFIFDWKSLPVEKQHIIKPPRRSKVIDFLRNSGFKVNIIAGYDDDRDIELAKCKVVLNIHGQLGLNHNPSPTECSNIFEHVRCDRLLETGYTVLSETSYELDREFINKYPNLKIINYADFFNLDIITRIINESVTNVTNVVSESVIEVVADDSIYNKTIYNKNKVDSDRVCDDTNNSMLQYGQLYNTDKVTHHEYHKYYEPVLKPFYNSYGSIVEIGLGTGVSLPMWKNLFKYAHIYGVDKEYENRGDDRHTIYKADQSNVNDLNNLKKSLTDKNVFFINDDGSHIPEHQLLTFNTLFPIVAEGGFYIIEDIETSYWTRGECYGYKTSYGYKHPNSMIEIFKEATDIINREFIVDKTRLSNKIQHYDYIESITFARNCIIVKKNYNANRDYRFKQFI